MIQFTCLESTPKWFLCFSLFFFFYSSWDLRLKNLKLVICNALLQPNTWFHHLIHADVLAEVAQGKAWKPAQPGQLVLIHASCPHYYLLLHANRYIAHPVITANCTKENQVKPNTNTPHYSRKLLRNSLPNPQRSCNTSLRPLFPLPSAALRLSFLHYPSVPSRNDSFFLFWWTLRSHNNYLRMSHSEKLYARFLFAWCKNAALVSIKVYKVITSESSFALCLEALGPDLWI